MTATNDPNNGEKPNLPVVDFLDKPPAYIRRPLTLVNGRAYASVWGYVKITEQNVTSDNPEKEGQSPNVTYDRPLFIIRDDGKIFSEQEGVGITPLKFIGAQVELPSAPRSEKLWSNKSLKDYLKGHRPDPLDVFERVVDVIDLFIDFEGSFANQREMAEVMACYVLATWFLDAFNVIGYMWPNGERGCGKTQLLAIVVELSYLGELILAGGSYASLRDLSDNGATLAFDDAENVSNPKYFDPDKRALLLAGNRRGSVVSVKEQVGKKWEMRYVNTYAPRLFSAIHLPDAVLASRIIIVPLIRTPNREKANSDPLEYRLWPHDRRQLLDDLWALGLSRLPELPAYERSVNANARLSGRNLEPWRAILAVAYWLEDAGVNGLRERMEQISIRYNSKEQPSLQIGDLTHLVIRALIACAISADRAKSAINKEWFFPTSHISIKAIGIANAEEIDIDTNRITLRTVGRTLGKLRFESKRPVGSNPRGWIVSRLGLERLCKSYGIPFPEELNTPKDDGTDGIDGTNGTINQAPFIDVANSVDTANSTVDCYTCGRSAWQEQPPGHKVIRKCVVVHPDGNEDE